ncbi:excinuclease ABC subunit UvrC [uncultured Helicobacter sp.]|uniref:excinuclease ABC subunit UvrC n=1 Tax=uncultured Helicobacter sp. TaxID=175537 RepID=UPI0025CE0AFA|nr:excinuclease ABC subunit UvrC [uncultured Helicobacter sp.]
MYSLLFTLQNLPTQPGIYQYFDKDDNLLYVGKAKNLKNRIKSYFSIHNDIITPKANLSQRIALMVSQVAKIHTLLTQTQEDALILENSLIKSLKPKYNILLRDDKTYPYIYIDTSATFPRFEITRKALQSKHIEYFGPFVSGARELLDSLYDALPLVQKKSCLKGKKACIFHQIHKCPAPCENKISTKQYAEYITQAKAFIDDRKGLIEILESKMQILSHNLQFEEAEKIRDRIQKLKTLKTQSIIDIMSGDYDIFLLDSAGQNHILMMLFIRNGRIVSSDFSFIHQEIHSQNLASLYTQALLNHYKTPLPLPPKEILIPYFDFQDKDEKDDLQKILQAQTQSHLKITQPQKGTKYNLLQLAKKNAQEILTLHTKEQNNAQNENATLYALKDLCNLSQVPYRIEVFDTSHHSGSHNVGGMVVYENGKFIRNAYRRFELHSSDEYSQMSEMLTRRAKRFESNPPPDLWLLDGGKAQINLALDILKSVGANVDIIAIAKMKYGEKHNAKAYRAKGNALDILRTQNAEFKLSTNDKRLQFCQKLRDKVHRYAITYHRNKKQKDIQKIQIQKGSNMDSSYSKAQIKRLLDYFGSFHAIQNAPKEQIENALSRPLKSNKDSK